MNKEQRYLCANTGIRAHPDTAALLYKSLPSPLDKCSKLLLHISPTFEQGKKLPSETHESFWIFVLIPFFFF